MASSLILPGLVEARRNHQRPLTREEALERLRQQNAAMAAQQGAVPEQSPVQPLPPNPRPNAPEVPHGMSLESITQNTEVPLQPNPEPRSPVRGAPLGVDMDAVREANPGQLPPVPEQTVTLDRGKGKEVLAMSQEDLAKAYENGAGPELPTKKTDWEKAMDLPNKQRRPFDLTPEEKAERAAKSEAESGDLDEPPPPEEMEAKMRGEVGEDELILPDPGENPNQEPSPYKPREAAPEPEEVAEEAVDPEAASRQAQRESMREGLKRRNSIDFWTKRTGLPRDLIAEMWDEGTASAGEGEDPRLAAISKMRTSDEVATAMYNREEQRNINVQNRASQNNRSRRQGIPVGMVMAIDGINFAKTPEELHKALVGAASVYPAQFGGALQMLMQGQITEKELQSRLMQTQIQTMGAMEAARYAAQAEQAKAEAANKDPVDKALERAEGAEFSTNGVNSVGMTATQLGIPPEEQPEFIANTFAPQMQELATGILDGNPASASDVATMKAVLSKITGGTLPSMDQFMSAFGGTLSKEDAYELLDVIYGDAGVRNARGWWGWANSEGESQLEG